MKPKKFRFCEDVGRSKIGYTGASGPANSCHVLLHETMMKHSQWQLMQSKIVIEFGSVDLRKQIIYYL